MTPEQLALLVDSRLSPAARILGLHISASEGEWVELGRDECRRLLEANAGKDRIARDLGDLVAFGYAERKPGGRGHADCFRFSIRESRTVTESTNGYHPESPDAKPDSVRDSRTLSRTASPATDSAPSASTGGRARADDPHLEQLRELLGPHSGVLDQLDRSADHDPGWPSQIWFTYRPPSDDPNDRGGPEWVAFGRHDQETIVRALANGLGDYAGTKRVISAQGVRGFVRTALREIERGARELVHAGTNGNGGGGKARASPPPTDTQEYTPTNTWTGLNR